MARHSASTKLLFHRMATVTVTDIKRCERFFVKKNNQGVSLIGNGNSLVSDGGVNTTVNPRIRRTPAHVIFSRVAQDLSHRVRFHVSPVCLELLQLTIFQIMLLIAAENLQARASTVESDWLADSPRAAEGNFWPSPNEETTQAVVERANVKKRDKRTRSIVSAEILKIGQYFSNKGSKKQFWKALQTLRRRKTNQLDGWTCIPKNQSVLEAESGQSKKICSTKKDARVDVNVPSPNKLVMLVWVNVCKNEVQNCRQIAATNTVILKESQKQ